MMSRYVTPGNLRHMSRVSRYRALTRSVPPAPVAVRARASFLHRLGTRQTRALTPKLSRRQDLAELTLLTGCEV